MNKGTKVIYNEDYISVLTRHRDNYKNRLDRENLPDARKELEVKYNYYENKLAQCLDFQDTIEEIINVEVPRITAIKTVQGYVIPAGNLQVV